MRLRTTFGTIPADDPNGEVGTVECEVTVPDDKLVTYVGLELLDENGQPSTILRTLMTTHTDIKGLHTICRRYSDRIDALEVGA